MVARDYETQDVLDAIAASMESLAGVTEPGPFEERLAAVEVEAAPYVLVLFHEIGRLEDALIAAKRRRRHVR